MTAKRDGGSMKLAAGAVVNALPVLLERSSGGGGSSQDSRAAGQTRMVARTVALVVKVIENSMKSRAYACLRLEHVKAGLRAPRSHAFYLKGNATEFS